MRMIMTTITTTTIRMASADLLKLTQWFSPAFPIGSFAYSHGLEAAIASNDVVDAASLTAWLRTILQSGAGRTDAILLAHAMASDADHTELNGFAKALCSSRERWIETSEQGKAFTETLNAVLDRSDPPAAMPVAAGRVASMLSVGAQDVIAIYLQSFVSNLVTIGVRFIPLGQTEGQRVLTELQTDIQDAAVFASTADLDDIATSTFASDLAAMEHETQEVRLFKT